MLSFFGDKNVRRACVLNALRIRCHEAAMRMILRHRFFVAVVHVHHRRRLLRPNDACLDA